MKYRVMIFIAKERLAAIDIRADEKADIISVDGNVTMEFASEKQIREFCQHIKDYYNVDLFSDLEMEISILRFDAVMKDVFLLLEEIKDAAEYNLVSVEKLLPWIAIKEGLIKVGTAIQVKTFELVYTVSLGKDMVLKCQIGGTDKRSYEFPIEKFSENYRLGKGGLLGYEDEKNTLLKKFNAELTQNQQRIIELENLLSEEKKKRKIVEDNLEKSTAEMDKIRDERERNANRCICKLLRKDKEQQMDLITSIFMSSIGGFKDTYTVMHCCENTEIVKQGQRIANVAVVRLGSRKLELDFVIKATKAGRIFWLYETASELEYGIPIALIGDLADTKEDVMRWYEKNK